MSVVATSPREPSARARVGLVGAGRARRLVATKNPTPIAAAIVLLLLAGCRPPGMPAPPAATSSAARARVAAVVNGEVITVDALEARLRADRDLSAEIAGLDDVTVDGAKRELLSAMIADTLIAQEAHRQGRSADDLRTSITGEVVVSEAEIEEAYRLLQRARSVDDPQTKRRVQRLLSGSPAECRARLRAFVQREKELRALQTFALALRSQATIQVLLEPPRTRTN